MAPHSATDSALASQIEALREQGEVVVELLPGESCCEGPLCDRQLVENDGQWTVRETIGD